MFIQNSNSYSTQIHTDNRLAALNDVVGSPSSSGIVKAIRLAYQDVNMTLERNLAIHLVTYNLTKYTHAYIYIYMEHLFLMFLDHTKTHHSR